MRNQDKEKLLPRVVRDLAGATLSGSVIILLFFVVIIFATGYQYVFTTLVAVCTALLALLSALRIVLARSVGHYNPDQWVTYFSVLTVLIAMTWSGFWSYAIYADGLNETTLISIVASVGIGSVGITAIAPLRKLSLVFVSLMVLPSGLAASMLPGGVGTSFAVMALTGTFFLYFIVQRMHNQYWSAQHYALLLEQRAADLSTATQAKSDFLAMMSHEIRTPMNGVLGMAQLLQNTSLDASQRKYTDIILSSGDALIRIINDILDLSRIEAGKMELHVAPFRLADCINAVTDLLSPEASKKGITLHSSFTPDLPEKLVGDVGRIRQVLTNLVGNAIKYTDEGGVSIRVSPALQDDVSIRLAIAIVDTGVGIDEESRRRVFESFTRAASADITRNEGTGLGLAITRQLVELMGGHIDITDNMGRGTIVSIQIPLGIAAADEPVEETPYNALVNVGAERFADVRVLVVEDNPVNRVFAVEILKRLGCRVTTANDGEQAVDAWKAGQFDAVLMDMQMPGLDGVGATAAIRSAESPGAHTPIIAVTANTVLGEREKCLSSGLDDYISKPFSITELQTVLDRWVRTEQADKLH